MGRLAPLAALAAVVLSPVAGAQEWGFRAGGTGRAEFTDNYQLRPVDQVSATTLTVAPIVTGYRRTETSQMNLLAGVGYNYVLGDFEGDNDYWSARLEFDGSTAVDRSTYGYNVGVIRDQTVRTETLQTGIVLGNATRTGATAGVNWSYLLTDRWTTSLNGSAYSNNYDDVQAGTALQDNRGYSVGGTLGYAWSPQTQFQFATTYARYTSDISDADSVSATLGFTHQYSPALTVSAYGGYFWSWIDATQTVLICPTTPTLCATGAVPLVPVVQGTGRNDVDTLFGGAINYRLTERTTFVANASQNVTPSGIGTITKVTAVRAELNHSFAERFRGQLFADWRRSTIPGTDTGNFRSDLYSAGAVLTYNLAIDWLLEVGVRHDRSEQRGVDADANVVFLSLAYNWPGQSISGWTGFDAPGFPAAAPGAGTPPSAVPGQPLGAPAPVPRSAGEPSKP